MKKRIFAMLLSALLVANISACNFGFRSEIEEPFENIDTTGLNFEETDEKIPESEENSETVDIESEYDTANTEKSPMESENEINESDDIDESIAVEMYKEALYGFMSRHIPNEFIDWNLWEYDDYLDCLSFAILDMDGDNFPELVVNYLGEHAVLSYVTGQKYLNGGDHGIRAMYGIRKDGSFYWTRSAGHERGVAKYEKDLYVELCRVWDNGIDDAQFFIGDQNVPEEKYITFTAQLCNEPADFYDLTEENIEKYVTLEIFNHK